MSLFLVPLTHTYFKNCKFTSGYSSVVFLYFLVTQFNTVIACNLWFAQLSLSSIPLFLLNHQVFLHSNVEERGRHGNFLTEVKYTS